MEASLLTAVETPAVIVDRERLLRNIDWAAALARRRGLALRPHVKTHKCVEIAQLQLERGAIGLTASKVDEALVFIEAGVPSITVAYPVVDETKLRRLLLGAREHRTDLRVVVDSRRGAELLARVAAEVDKTVGALIEIDVGLHRCGLRDDDPLLLELASALRDARRLKFTGLISHAGHAYAAADSAHVATIAAEEGEILGRARRRVEAGGVEVAEVSVGSTPTVLASDSFDRITEIRPGNYVFMDLTPLRLGLIDTSQIALTVLATIVSRNDEFLITDAGSKVLTSDLGAHGMPGVTGYGGAYLADEPLASSAALNVARLSEEHGLVERNGRDIPIGSKLRIIPNHACPVVNLADELVVVSGHDVVARWRVAARGKVR